MDKAKKLRSELIAHIQSETAKAKSEDSSEQMSPEESSLFENRIRLFLENNSSEYEKSIQVVLNEIYSTTRESSDFWSPTLEVEEEAKLNSEADTNR
jgi:hypothetical protein